MSQNKAQDSQNEFTTSVEQAYRRKPIGPISFYTWMVLIPALMGLFVLYLFFATPLSLRPNLTALSVALSVLFGALFGWVLAGLAVCLLLQLWLTGRRVALVVTLVLAVLWGAGLLRYVKGMEPAPLFTPSSPEPIYRVLAPVLTLALTVGIPLLLSLAASGAVFLRGLYLTSGYLLPLPEKSHRDKVFSFLRDYLVHANYPAYVVVDERHEEDQVEERVSGNRFAGSVELGQLSPIAPGFVLTDCNHAVAISSGTKFKGVHGPGVILTGYADQIVRVFDLRPQLRAFHVEALTRDGIKIRVLAFVPFKIDSRGRQSQLGDSLPYNKNAAHKAFLAEKVEREDKETTRQAWHRLPRIAAERILQNIISTYNFDDLYGPYQLGREPPRKAIAQAFREQLAAELEPLGIQLVGGGISDLEPADPRVYEERVRSWRAEWTRKVTLKRAEGQAEWLRMVERARAEAQADLILSLGRQLEELSTEQTALRPEAALSLLVSILDGLMGQQPTLGQLLPEETLQALSEIRKAIMR
jgi:regulator of protease activity HflC (stomatin/prohibitin superfamily)